MLDKIGGWILRLAAIIVVVVAIAQAGNYVTVTWNLGNRVAGIEQFLQKMVPQIEATMSATRELLKKENARNVVVEEKDGDTKAASD